MIMIRECYKSQPLAIEIHQLSGGKTDVILRKNIEAVEKVGDTEGNTYTAYECDEVQARLEETVTTETVEQNFDDYWELATNPPKKQSLEEKVVQLEQIIESLLSESI